MPGDGELTVALNPAGFEDETGRAFLSTCFATRWSEEMYHWYLQRSFGGEAPDRLLLLDGARALAGCGLVYRLLRTPDGAVHPVSVVVAAATAPEARGRGCYARVLQAAVERSTARGCAALLGFVTADNATGRGLRRLGAAEIASAYIVSRAGTRAKRYGGLQLDDAQVDEDWPARAALRRPAPGRSCGFHYPTSGAWRSQMVERPHTMRPLHIGATSRALVERVGDTDRLQWLDGDPHEHVAAIRALLAQAGRWDRKFFMYSTSPQETAAARRLGLEVRPGFLMILPLQTERGNAVADWTRFTWQVQSGDRM